MSKLEIVRNTGILLAMTTAPIPAYNYVKKHNTELFDEEDFKDDKVIKPVIEAQAVSCGVLAGITAAFVSDAVILSAAQALKLVVK